MTVALARPGPEIDGCFSQFPQDGLSHRLGLQRVAVKYTEDEGPLIGDLHINFVVVSFLAAGFSLLLPVWYKSSATILPPSAGGGELFPGGVGVVNPLSALGFGGASEEINNYITILKSRRLRETVIHEFNLMEKYKAKTIEIALKRLDSKIDVEVTDERALIFSILDRDSLQAKAMAQAILRELGKTTINLGTRAGQRNR
ncbi:unnamed protein product, partial [marine sediment metagenome]